MQACTGRLSGRIILPLWLCSLAYPVAPAPAAAAPLSAPTAEPGGVDRRSPWVGFPTLDYNSDRGVGVGAVAAYYVFHPVLRPYKAQLFLKLYTSSRQIHDDELRLDVLRPLDLPVRLRARVGALVTRTANFCGVGPEVACDVAEARQAVEGAGVSDAELAGAVEHYYLVRMRRVHGAVTGEYLLRPLPHRVALLGGWRGALLQPGDLSSDGPYEPSLYTSQHPGGERGLDSALVVGVSVDNRTREAAPLAGYFVEVSTRQAHAAWGSAWRWRGVYAAVDAYVPLPMRPGWLVAVHSAVDVVWGDISAVELARSGSIVTAETPRFGGHAAGRGVRESRFFGKLNLLQQVELRGHVASTQIFEQLLEIGAAAYADAAWVRADAHELARLALTQVVWGGGLGLRLVWNEAFVLRFDTGVSPAEGYAPRLYIKVGNPF